MGRVQLVGNNLCLMCLKMIFLKGGMICSSGSALGKGLRIII